jgi:hypothetical protein
VPRPLVFVLLSQRSGTSALVHTLNEHPRATVGIERYKFLWRDWPEQYDASLFEEDRFLALDPTETNILGTERWDNYYARMRERWGPDTLSGDKVQPITPEMVRGILDATPQARFLYIFRQLLPLASSYAVRARNPDDQNWSDNRGALAGLKVWRRDNLAVLNMLDDPELGPAILPIAYEDFYQGDPVTIDAVLDHVGLDHAPPFDRMVEKNAQRYQEVQQKELALTYEEVEDLIPHAQDPVYLDLHRRAPSSRSEPSTPTDAVRVRQLQDRVKQLDSKLTKLQNRRAVKAALAAADGYGRVRRRLQERKG